MPRTADRFASHLFGTPREPITSQRPSQRVFVVRPRGASDSVRSDPVQVSIERRRSLDPNLPTGRSSGRVSRTSGGDDADLEAASSSHPSTHRLSVVDVVETPEGEVEIVMQEDEPMVLTVLEETNMDGVRHLSAKSKKTRFTWLLLIIIFTCLAFYQIMSRFHEYIVEPFATNVEADYPSEIAFPTIAICNNNQFRLTYLTGRVQNRRMKNLTHPIEGVDENSDNIFDKALLKSWDMDAMKFLRSSGHLRFRMILDCTWPNGSKCKPSDWKLVWTLTGPCWAINHNATNPIMVNGAGADNALKLLLNIERYERIESCTEKFRTTRLPGVRVLIYNQTDVPLSIENGVNVPPGYTMDIPFYMKQRHKYPGYSCIKTTDGSSKKFPLDFDDPSNTHTCLLRNYLAKIEQQCGCTLRKMYDPTYEEKYKRSGYPPCTGNENSNQPCPSCNVEDYFRCVQQVLKWGREGGFRGIGCQTSCDEIDYVAWQDMNELPNNIFPKLIDSNEDDDEAYMETMEELEDEFYQDTTKDEHYKCEHNQILDDTMVNRIKREAHLAYEKQARYQEDVLLRTKKLIQRMRQTAQKLKDLEWGWLPENFKGVHPRLQENVDCYGNVSGDHSDVFNAITNPAAKGEERRAKQLVHLLNKDLHFRETDELKTISDVKHVFGADRVENLAMELQEIDEILDKLYSIYDEDNYRTRLSKDLKKVDTILLLMDQFENGKLRKIRWAEKMQSRTMKHFFDEDFYEDWYNVITKDLDQKLFRTIIDLDDQAKYLSNLTVNGTGLEMASVLLFGDTEPKHIIAIANFLDDILKCTMGPVKDYANETLLVFKKSMHDFQSAYTNLFKKELPEYLDNFEFGNKFVKENFAIVNVFLHKMNVEHWHQYKTMSFMGLLCDVGGTLGLFLGASLLTIIELIYLCFQYGFCKKSWDKIRGHPWVKKHTTKIRIKSRKRWKSFRDQKRKLSKRYFGPNKDIPETTDEDESDFEYDAMLPLKDETEEDENAINERQEKRKRKKGHYGLNLPKVVPGIFKGSFRRKKPENEEEEPDVEMEQPLESLDLTEVKPEDEENSQRPTQRPERLELHKPKSKEVVIPIESSDDNFEKGTLQAKAPVTTRDHTRPLTPEIIIAPQIASKSDQKSAEEPEKLKQSKSSSKVSQEMDHPHEVSKGPSSPDSLEVSKSPQEDMSSEKPSDESLDKSKPTSEVPSTSKPRKGSSSAQDSPMTDSQYTTDSLQAYSEPEMGMQDESEPEEFGEQPRKALLDAIDSLLKDDRPMPGHLDVGEASKSKDEAREEMESEKAKDEPMTREEMKKVEKPAEIESEKLERKNEATADKSSDTEVTKSPGLPESVTETSEDRQEPETSDSEPIIQSSESKPTVEADSKPEKSPEDFQQSSSTTEKFDTPFSRPETSLLEDSGISGSQQPSLLDIMTPSTSSYQSEATRSDATPKIDDSGIPDSQRSSKYGPVPSTPVKSETTTPTVQESPLHLQQPSQEVARQLPQIEQQPPSESREPSAAPTDPQGRRSKSLSSSLYPPSDPKPASDSETEFVPDPGPSRSKVSHDSKSLTPELPTPRTRSAQDTYPIAKCSVDPPEAILKIEDSDTNTTSSSGDLNAPRLIFGSQPSTSVEEEMKAKDDDKETVV